MFQIREKEQSQYPDVAMHRTGANIFVLWKVQNFEIKQSQKVTLSRLLPIQDQSQCLGVAVHSTGANIFLSCGKFKILKC